jgi:hypothetical protein
VVALIPADRGGYMYVLKPLVASGAIWSTGLNAIHPAPPSAAPCEFTIRVTEIKYAFDSGSGCVGRMLSSDMPSDKMGEIRHLP